MSKNRQIIAIIGPTGSGKTSFAKVLAQKFNGKIISADSRQIYKGMDIGTAKDKSFPQDLIDFLPIDQTFTVSDYQKMATDLINQYLHLKNLPILAGGTGLYIEAVLYGYVIPNLKKESLELREKLEKLSESELRDMLKKVDLLTFAKIDPKNKRRIIRALEVSLLSSRPFSEQRKKIKPKFDALIIGIKTDRETLYSKIDARVEQMIKDGLVEEVRNLLKKYPKNSVAFNSIGYKEIIDYLDDKFTLKEAISKIKINTHAYIRRQDTWFRRDKNIKWVKSLGEAERLVKKFLNS